MNFFKNEKRTNSIIPIKCTLYIQSVIEILEKCFKTEESYSTSKIYNNYKGIYTSRNRTPNTKQDNNKLKGSNKHSVVARDINCSLSVIDKTNKWKSGSL